MRISLALFVLLVASLPTTTHASEDYPEQLQRDGWTPRKPECSLCHVSGVTGYDSVHTPFGTAMRLRGLVAGDGGSLTRALEQMMADEVDSDADGTTDVEELASETDPSSPTTYVEPRFGCAASHSLDAPRSLLALLALVSTMALVRGARRRHRARRAGPHIA